MHAALPWGCIRASDPLGSQGVNQPRELGRAPTDAHGQSFDLTARRIMFAQRVESGTLLLHVFAQATAEIGIIAARIVDGAAQHRQCPLQIDLGIQCDLRHGWTR